MKSGNNLRKQTAAFLSLLLFAGTLVSCGESQTNAEPGALPNDPSVVQVPVEEQPAETEPELRPDIPEGYTFGGKNFRILCNDYDHIEPGWSNIDIDAEALNGTPVNDAVFNRNAAVEAAYDCAVEEYKLKIDDAKNELIRATQAGDASIDLATMYFWCGWIAERAMSGAFIDLGSLDSVNLSNPWYDQNSVEDFTVMGKTLFVVSSLTIGDRIATAGMVFNKQLYEDYQLSADYGNIYDLVREGKWTHEALSSMVLSLSEDVDGDGKMTADDFYGLLYERDSLVSFFNSYGMRVATPDDDGLPVFSLVTDENANKLDATFDFLYHKDNCFHVMNWFDGSGTNFTTGMTNMFKNNQAMYMWIRFADVELLRTMDVDFGILPVPKWDEAQDQYYSTVNEYMGVGTVIPASCGDPEMTGTFIEAISCESMKQLIPAYYDVVLQGKISRDVESTEMLDLIFSNRVYDIGMIFNIGGFGGTIYGMTRTYDSSYATLWAKNQKRFSKEMERFVKKWENIGE